MRLKVSILTLIFLSLVNSSTYARKFFYSPSESSAFSTTFIAGDTVILKNGTWNNKVITFKGTGSETKPVLFIAETSGEVIFSGSSTITISGLHVILSGILLQGNTTTSSKHIVTFPKTSSNCRLTNSAIIDYNPSNVSTWPTTDNKWVSIYGTKNRVDHCYFEGKGNIGTLLVVWLESGKSANHSIDNNHFYKRSSLLDSSNKELNGQEIIRIGDSSTSMTFANCIIENNFFEECNGEIETISNKSCGNIYRNNVFYKNNGMLTLRHGNNCEVYSNYFLGEGKNGSGGVRIIGENHFVYNNYFQNLTGSGYRTAICVVNGKLNSLLNEYFQVINAQVAFNTFYNCINVFNIGYQGGNELPPINSTIAHNVIFASSTSQTGVQISNSSSQVTWKNNLMYQGRFISFSPTENQFVRTTANLSFESSDVTYGIYKPTNQSIITSNYKTTEYPQIQSDIEGKIRPVEKMIGAFEMNGTPDFIIPTPKTIGCSFINKDATGLFSVYRKSDKLINDLKLNSDLLNVKSDEATLRLKIHNVKGQLICVSVSKVIDNVHTFRLPNNLSGLYLFTFDNGIYSQSRKMIISR